MSTDNVCWAVGIGEEKPRSASRHMSNLSGKPLSKEREKNEPRSDFPMLLFF